MISSNRPALLTKRTRPQIPITLRADLVPTKIE